MTGLLVTSLITRNAAFTASAVIMVGLGGVLLAAFASDEETRGGFLISLLPAKARRWVWGVLGVAIMVLGIAVVASLTQ